MTSKLITRAFALICFYFSINTCLGLLGMAMITDPISLALYKAGVAAKGGGTVTLISALFVVGIMSAAISLRNKKRTRTRLVLMSAFLALTLLGAKGTSMAINNGEYLTSLIPAGITLLFGSLFCLNYFRTKK